ncbi:septal ring lytic transglycosylase RlpA family protein [Nitrosophilus kaiyonis]|uniref:septal ring lytic transglycosylase RlpA family protein n=1 Tax=Nitrosophilus kaiyonis TaxID=2930200 RepID=UPI002491A01E|nr:septal ring lytic transglycosylase RlpA family protein [Nitrosophilus kaiyonis]
MSLSIKKFYFILLITFLFSGCANRYSYTYPSAVYSKPKSSKAVHRATMRPYKVGNRVYYPTVVRVGTIYRGIASWYGPNFHGKRTSNGEYYNMYDFTAAHKTLPMNTMVKVTNLRNGKSVVVRINDRGPFVKNRLIDLSYSAAKKLDIIATGTAPVELQVLGFDKIISTLAKEENVKKEVKLSNFGVQIGSFRRYQGALITKRRYSLVDNRYKAVIKKFIVDDKPLYRVWLMGFNSEEEARDFIARGMFDGAFVVRK